jgi:hypothetical protein
MRFGQRECDETPATGATLRDGREKRGYWPGIEQTETFRGTGDAGPPRIAVMQAWRCER